MIFGELREFGAVQSEQRLIGGDDGLAGRDRRPHGVSRRAFRAADDLDDHIDIRIVRERHGVFVPGQTLGRNAAVAGAIPG